MICCNRAIFVLTLKNSFATCLHFCFICYCQKLKQQQHFSGFSQTVRLPSYSGLHLVLKCNFVGCMKNLVRRQIKIKTRHQMTVFQNPIKWHVCLPTVRRTKQNSLSVRRTNQNSLSVRRTSQNSRNLVCVLFACFGFKVKWKSFCNMTLICCSIKFCGVR